MTHNNFKLTKNNETLKWELKYPLKFCYLNKNVDYYEITNVDLNYSFNFKSFSFQKEL